MNERVVIIGLSILLMGCFGCKKTNDQKELIQYETEYILDKSLYVISENLFVEGEKTLLSELSMALPRVEYKNAKGISLSGDALTHFKNDLKVSGRIYSDNFALLVYGHSETTLTTGKKSNSYKSIYLVDLENSKSLEVYGNWLEEVSKYFYIYKEYIVLEEVTDPLYDIVTEEKIKNAAKKYKYLVIKISDFSIVNSERSQLILDQMFSDKSY